MMKMKEYTKEQNLENFLKHGDLKISQAQKTVDYLTGFWKGADGLQWM